MFREIKSTSRARSKKSAKQRLFILDPDLQIGTGHNYQTSVRVAASAVESGYAVTILANRHFPESKALNKKLGFSIRAHFKALAFDFPGISEGRRRIPVEFNDEYELHDWEIHLQQLLAIDEELRFTADDTFYCHTVSTPLAHAWFVFLMLRPDHLRPKLYAQIYILPELIQGERVGNYTFCDILNKYNQQGFIGRYAFFHTETIRLQKTYEEQVGLHFPMMVGPLPDHCFEQRMGDDPRPVIAFLGEARHEKGFQLLPGVIDRLIQELGDDFQKIRFQLQTFSSPLNDTVEIKTARRTLENLAKTYDNIQILGKLSTEEYQTAIDETDICFLGYEPESYRIRGSGVAVEMLAGGKMLLTSPDIDVAETFDGYNLLVPSEFSAGSFAEALLKQLKKAKFDRASLRATKSGLEYFAESGFLGRLFDLHEKNAEGFDQPPLKNYQGAVVYLAMGGDSGGSEFVQRGHLKALKDLDVLTIMIDIPWPFQDANSYNAWKKERVSRFFKSWDDFEFLPLFGSMLSGRIAESGFSNPQYMDKRENLAHSAQRSYMERFFGLNSTTKMALDRFNLKGIFTNYAYSLPMVRNVFSDVDAPVVVELHDWLEHQNRIRRKLRDKDDFDTRWNNELDKRERLDEQKTSELADHAIAIAGPLKESYETENNKVEVLRPIPIAGLWDHRVDISDPVACETYLKDNIQKNVYMKTAMLLHDVETVEVDLLYVGTSHPANNVSLLSFIEKTFLPFLAPKGYRLFIAGSISRVVNEVDETQLAKYPTSIVPLGRVDDLGVIYQMAKVTVLSITEGTGFPTKVIETLSDGQAFAINDRALYDLADEAKEYFHVATSPEDMADDILSLLESEDARSQRAQDGFRFASKYFSHDRYYQKLAEYFELEPPTEPYEETVDEHREAVPFPVRIEEDEFFEFESKTTYTINGQILKHDFMLGDWSFPEAAHTWIDGRRAGFLLRAPKNAGVPHRIYLAASTVGDLVASGQTMTVLINGEEIGTYKFNKNFMLFDIGIPPGTILPGGTFVMEFVAKLTADVPGDIRDLSISVKELTIKCEEGAMIAPPAEPVAPAAAPEPKPEPVEPKSDIIPTPVKDGEWQFVSAASGFDGTSLDEGWSHMEADGVWLVGSSGIIHVGWNSFDTPKRVEMFLSTKTLALDEGALNLVFSVNGVKAHEELIDTDQRSILFDIPSDALSDDDVYRIELAPDRNFVPEGDLRTLSVMLSGFSLASSLYLASHPDKTDAPEPAEPETPTPAVADTAKTPSTPDDVLASGRDFESEFIMMGRVADIPVNTVVKSSLSGGLSAGQMGDWSFPESGHQWMEGREAALVVRPEDGSSKIESLKLDISFFRDLVINATPYRILINGEVQHADSAQAGEQHLIIDLRDSEPAETYLIEFIIGGEGGLAQDGRQLSLCLNGVAIYDHLVTPTPEATDRGTATGISAARLRQRVVEGIKRRITNRTLR